MLKRRQKTYSHARARQRHVIKWIIHLKSERFLHHLFLCQLTKLKTEKKTTKKMCGYLMKTTKLTQFNIMKLD